MWVRRLQRVSQALPLRPPCMARLPFCPLAHIACPDGACLSKAVLRQRSTGANPASPADLDPGTDYLMWGPRSGQDFRANHAHPGIDYAVIHM